MDAADAGGNSCFRSIQGHSATTHRSDDFQAVTVLQCTQAILTTRNDLAVALHGDALAGEAELADQLAAAQRVVEAAWLAIDDHGNHGLAVWERFG